MNDLMFRHVLFKDLKDYLNKRDYLKGYTATELLYIRKNIGAIGVDEIENELQKINSKCLQLSHEDLLKLINDNKLVPGSLYAINDFQTIYQSNLKNKKGLYITWGGLINPSPIYTIVVLAISSNLLASNVFILDPNLFMCDVKYNINKQVLDDGIETKGNIIYMRDENLNVATFDFKNILLPFKNKIYHVFSNKDGLDISNICYNNDITFSKNLIINQPISGLICHDEKLVIDTNLDLTDNTLKLIITYNNIKHLDYLDIETLTHLFYALESYIC